MRSLPAPLPCGFKRKFVWGWGAVTAPLPSAHVGVHRQPSHPVARSVAACVPQAGDRFSLDFQAPQFADDGSTEPVILAARRAREEKAGILLNAAWEPSTKRTYERLLKLHVHEAEVTVDMRLLPIDTSAKFMLVFADMEGMHWATVRLNKAAVRAWHIANNCEPLYQAAWDCRASHFWYGLKKNCVHTSAQKRPLNISEPEAFVDKRLAAGTAAGIRDAAMAAFTFFGIRRVSEAVALQRSEFKSRPDSVGGYIKRQKNDPEGRGQWCWLPRGASQDFRHCPAALLEAWVHVWDERFGNIDGPLFSVVAGASPKAVSTDSWRKIVKANIPGADVSSHSCRKGGATYWTHVVRLQPDVVQAQGGWATRAMLDNLYAKTPADRVQGLIVESWRTRSA